MALLLHPETRAELLKHSRQLSLDPNTAQRGLSLSKENRKVTCSSEAKVPCSDHPDRFTFFDQVLCTEALSGRCYWEVEWKGGKVFIGVSYKDISRTDTFLGHDDKSWSIQCCNESYYLNHNYLVTRVSGPQSSRIGVYLDHKAGTLSFYSVVSDTVILLHRVQTTFTQPLHPGIYLGRYGDSAEIIKLW